MTSRQGYSAVVTGASSGIGRAVASRFLAEGWTVVGVDLDEGGLRRLGAESERFVSCVADIRNEETLKDALETALISKPPVLSAVNVAGIFPPTTLDTYSETLYREIFDVNVLGTLNVVRVVSDAMRSSGEGRGAIVNMAAGNAYGPAPQQLVYAASKAAVISLTRSLAVILARDGILVNGLAPGWVDTPGNERTGRMVGIESQILLGRVAQPAEIAEWTWRLGGSDPAPYMTGETLLVAGGLIMR